jgi:tRNA nucleotidyltransferase (CCA-adding enzyme)
MQVYLVGGAVRDRLLGRAVVERDWVVVGATPAAMESLGYRRVGRDFPVFLHPETGEEYALARTERKTGAGYHGFQVHADPGVTLEQDLQRRDLTINAIAEDAKGNRTDPWGGQQDIAQRVLRHVSPAFSEDPVRILRVARFAARFHHLGFTVAPATRQLMAEMVQAGEAAALVPERVWQETAKALAEPNPEVYVQELRACGALAVIFPEIDALFGVPQSAKWHPEVDTGAHLLLALRYAGQRKLGALVTFAVLTHDLGKATTPAADLPRHPGHEQRSGALLVGLAQRLGVPNAFRDLALAVARLHGQAHRAEELRAGTLLELLEGLDALRRPERLEQFVAACEADVRGRTGLEGTPYPQGDILRDALAAARAVSSQPLLEQGLAGPALGEALRAARLTAIKATRKGPAASAE